MLAVNDILLGLATPHVEVPEALLSAAREQREAVIEALLPVLDAWVARAEDPDATPSDEDSWLPDYAMFLLAEFREPRAFDFFVRLCELDEDASDQWLGDMLTEDMQAWLASTCLGREETLYSLMADEQRYEWSRHAACDALLILAVNRGVALDTFVGRLVGMANAQSRSAENAFWNALASLQYDLRDDVLMSIVRAAYDDALVDDLHITRHELEQRLSARPDDVLGSIELIRDIVRDAGKGIAWLIQARNRSDEEVSSFDEGVWDEVPLPYVREGPKVGRNDPCPCGSGRKYKKCCLA